MNKMKLNIQLFAGSVSIGTITETTDINTNQSTFTIPATMTTSGSTYNNDNAYMTLQWRYSGGSSWTTISKKTFGISQNSSKTKSWTLSLTHNDDGTLTDVQFRVQWYITSSTSGTSSTKTYTPTTIPRASDIDSITDGTTDYKPTVKWTPKNSNFKFKISYSFGSYSTTSDLISPNTTNQYTYNGLYVYSNIFDNVSSARVTATATLYTYQNDGTTLIGSKTKTFNVNLNATSYPGISVTILRDADSKMEDLDWPIYVQNHSKLELQASITHVGASTFAPQVVGTISTNNQTFSMNAYGTKTFTTNTLTTSGSKAITGQATDSRGRSDNTTVTYNVVAYSNPTISTAQVERCDVNGNVAEEGQYLKISYAASISSCSGYNTPYAVYKIGYRIHNTSDYTYISLGTNATSKNLSGMLFTDGIKAASSTGTKVQLPTTNTYDIQFFVEDAFTEYKNVQTLETGFDLMNFNPNGKAMAIGKVSEAGANEELFEVDLPTKFTKYIKDELVVDKIRSKNMFDKNNRTTGLTYNSTGGTTSLANSFVQYTYIPVKPNTKYTLSTTTNYSSTQDYRLVICEYNNSKTFIQRNLGGTNVGNKYTITTTSNTYYVRLCASTVTLNELQFEEGSATDYSPYQELNSNIYKNVRYVSWETMFIARTDSTNLNLYIPISMPSANRFVEVNASFSIRLYNADGTSQGNYDIPTSAINSSKINDSCVYMNITKASMSSNPGTFTGLGVLTTNLELY